MTFIAGPYTATYGGAALGQVDDGFELDYGAKIEDIMSDIFPSREDGVYQGLDCVIRCILNEPTKAGVADLIWPWNATFGNGGVVGRLMSSMAQSLVLTACAGTTASPAAITVPRAVIWTDRVVTKFGTMQRKIPVVIIGLPVSNDNASNPMACGGGYFFTAV